MKRKSFVGGKRRQSGQISKKVTRSVLHFLTDYSCLKKPCKLGLLQLEIPHHLVLCEMDREHKCSTGLIIKLKIHPGFPF